MANILLFEDYSETILDVHEAISITEHEVVAQADSLNRAQHFISMLISKELHADVILLDGTLDQRNRPSEFRYTFELDGTEPIKKRIFGKPKPPTPREIVVPNTEYGIGCDARMIKKILDACEINIPIIGISGDSMDRNGVEVDFDLGKYNLRERLVPALHNVLNIE